MRGGGCSDVLQKAQRPWRILAELWTIPGEPCNGFDLKLVIEL